MRRGLRHELGAPADENTMSFNLAATIRGASKRNLPAAVGDAAALAVDRIQQGRFQRSLSLVVAATSVASGLEVGYEHYKGSYSNPVMYTPVVLSGLLAGVGLLGFFNRWAGHVLLRWVSITTLADGVIGF